MRSINAPIQLAAAVLLAITAFARAQTYNLTINTPTIDRWNYPFDSSPGFSETAATFSALGQELVFGPFYTFDTRDSQMILGWDTNTLVPVGQGECRYRITSVVVRIAVLGDPPFQYDPSYDPRISYLTGGVDSDPGRPVELYGTAFRSGWTSGAPTLGCPPAGGNGFPCYYEGDSILPGPPFGPCICRDQRYAYATDYINRDTRDIANNIRDNFDPKPFAVGQIPGVPPGQYVPANADMVFTLNTADPDVQTYLRGAMNSGRLLLSLSSLQPASSVGGPGSGEYAKFYTKENPFGFDSDTGTIRWARLTATVELVQLVGDINHDHAVNTADLTLLLQRFGQTVTSDADLNCDNAVNTADLTLLLQHFGQSLP